MGCVQLVLFFLLGTAHFSFAKEEAIATESDFRYLSKVLRDGKFGLPDGEESMDVVRVSSVRKEEDTPSQTHYYEFEARGHPSEKLYQCSLVVASESSTGSEQSSSQMTCSSKSRQKNSIILGGIEPINVANNQELEDLKAVIGEGVRKIQGSEHLMRVVKYYKASKQVVSGTLIRATVEVANTDCTPEQVSNAQDCHILTEGRQLCDVEVWLKPWMKFKEVTHVQCKPRPRVCAGCPKEADPNNAFVQDTLKSTLKKLNAEPHSTQKLSVVKVNKVTSQVIAGIKYTVEFEAKDEISGKTLNCTTVIISQPWITKNPIIEDFKCTPVTSI